MQTDFKIYLMAAICMGIVTGVFFSSSFTEADHSKCEELEESIKANSTGAVACFPPGVIDLNQTDRVQDSSNLECVCRRSFEGSVQLWGINKAD